MRLNSFEYLKNNENKLVTMTGKTSEIIGQHLVANTSGYPHFKYFDLEDGFQILVYSSEPLPLNQKIQITGKVIAVRGASKRPESGVEKETKVDEDYVEYHIIVDNWIVFQNI